MTECFPSRFSCGPSAMSDSSVESEQAVGDPLEIVDLLHVGARLGPIRRRSDAEATSGSSCERRSSFVARTIGTFVPSSRSVRSTASSWRNVTTGFPSAMHSIAKSPYQPAFSWSTTMSASR